MIRMPLLEARAAECAGCYCYQALPEEERNCMCPDAEKVLRMIVGDRSTKPLTEGEKKECFAEIDKVEGYSSADLAAGTDWQIANGVLCAWTDYARDKGLL